ncbi:hypothetical protein BDV37DRAFT_191440 [Aspergillus pseudonomiae]|uniref:Uncharacterized protein n=1 Tax=Aspergillus pseudonomiae TaxID=1506151 RepID=A0A5N7DP40_9EURO|nr:uncharacterized protein BDV37DRAFT_191440 [Aspergillus pseudonomiae]KAE8408237.1 hypothetical protein BDV37DRAFT_191440 [Aspergillus pseudonomiae]
MDPTRSRTYSRDSKNGSEEHFDSTRGLLLCYRTSTIFFSPSSSSSPAPSLMAFIGRRRNFGKHKRVLFFWREGTYFLCHGRNFLCSSCLFFLCAGNSPYLMN